MSGKNKLDYQLKMIMKYNRDGSPNTQQTRFNNLMRGLKHLQEERGYGERWDIQKFGRKEVCRIVNDWRESGKVSHGSMRNYASNFRWLAERVGNGDTIPNNQDLGIQSKTNHENYGVTKAVELDQSNLALLGEREQLATELRAAFGLRTEESLKFSHQYATERQSEIRLKGSWCKGGRERTIPVTNEYQQDLLNRVGRFQQEQGDRSMIPNHRTFKSYYRDYNEARQNANVPGHGLRHQWAQDRFKEVSGLDAPHAGGRPYSELDQAEKERYELAEKVVNHELGHGAGRQDITATYIGERG